MSMTALDLLLHPVRLRIVNAMSGGRTLTTAQLCAHLTEISQATLYRHVGMLVEGGILEVDGEQQVRGTVERRYRLCQQRALVTADTAKSMSLEDHRHGFAAAMAALIAEFNAYLEQEGADPYADSVGYRQSALWLTEAECTDIIDEVRTTLVSRLTNKPSPERRPYLMSAILFPTEPRATRAAGGPSRSNDSVGRRSRQEGARPPAITQLAGSGGAQQVGDLPPVPRSHSPSRCTESHAHAHSLVPRAARACRRGDLSWRTRT